MKQSADNTPSNFTHQHHEWDRLLSETPLLASGAALCGEIEALGGEALIVGGVVRDILLGQSISDVDIATNVPLEALEAQFSTHDIGRSKDFGIVTVRFQDLDFEVANFRSESGYTDERHPDKVILEQKFEADSSRRDLTINAMGITKDGVIIDYHGGVADIENRLIQTVGDPHQRFSEDALRLIRAARFAATLGFGIAPETEEAMMNLRHKVDGLASERIKEELFKTAKQGGEVFADFILCLDEAGLLERILPELTELKGLEHLPQHHPEGGVWEHVLAAVRASESESAIDNLAILFHDLGKAVTRGYHEDGRVHYHGHEAAGVPVFLRLASRLKFSNAEKATIAHSVEFHMLGHKVDEMSDKKVLQLRQSPHWKTFYHVVKADAKCRMHLWSADDFDAKMSRVEDLLSRFGEKEAFERRMSVLIDGQKIIQLTGVEGPEIGRIKNAVRDEILRLDFNISASEIDELILSLV